MTLENLFLLCNLKFQHCMVLPVLAIVLLDNPKKVRECRLDNSDAEEFFIGVLATESLTRKE